MYAMPFLTYPRGPRVAAHINLFIQVNQDNSLFSGLGRYLNKVD